MTISENTIVAVVGLGYVGLPLAVEFGKKYRTIGYDLSEAHIPDFSPLVGSFTTVGKHMKGGAIVVYESTVYPGATEEVCIPILEKKSGMRWVGRTPSPRAREGGGEGGQHFPRRL